MPTSSTTLGGGATTPPTTMYISSSSGRSAVEAEEEVNDEDDIGRYFTRAVYITTDPMSATKTPSPTSDDEDNDKSIRAITIVGGGNNVLVAESPTLVGFADAKKKPLSMSSTTTGRVPSSYSYEGGHQDLLLLDEPPTVARLVSVASSSSSSSLLDDVIVLGGEGKTTAGTNDGSPTDDTVVQQIAGEPTGEQLPIGPPSVARLVSLQRNYDLPFPPMDGSLTHAVDDTVRYADPPSTTTSSRTLYTTQSWYPPALVRQRGGKLQNHRRRALLEQPVLEEDQDDDHNDNCNEAYHRRSPRRRRSAVKRRVCSSSSNKKVLASSTNYLSTFLDYESPSKPNNIKKWPPPTPPPLLPTSESLLDIVSTPVRRQYHRHPASSTTRMNRLLFDEGVGASFVTMVVPTKMHDAPSSESYSTPPQAPKYRRQRLE